MKKIIEMSDQELDTLLETLTVEEYEQLDELSKKTVQSYQQKSGDSQIDMDYTKKGQERKRYTKAALRKGEKRADGEDLAWRKQAAGRGARVLATEDTGAQDTLRPQNKTEMLNAAILKMSGMSIEDLSKFNDEVLAQVGHEADGAPDSSAANKATLNMKPSAASTAMKESVKEDLALVFGEGEDLSEELKTNVSTLFEAALESRMTIRESELVDEMNVKLDEAYTQISEEMADKLDAYLDSVVESWLTDNEVAIESALRNELMEDFIDGLGNLFAEHYINIPEEKVQVVEELAAKVETLEAQLDATLTENAGLKAKDLDGQKADVVTSVCEGLALTSAEKLRSLVETVEFTGDLDDFTKKVNLIKESVLGAASKKATSTGILTEESDPNAAAGGNAPDVVLSPEIAMYKNAISRSVRS